MPGLTVHRSNRVEHLGLDLAAQLHLRPPADPMEPWWLLVGSHGMERYLRHTLAERLGVCTQLNFDFPAKALVQLLDCALGRPSLGAQSAYAPDVMALSMLGLWSSMPAAALGHVGAYLGEARAPWDRKAYALARAMADVFDCYLHYRPEYVRAFEKGQVPAALAGDRDAEVQAALFERLVAGAEEPHFAARVAALDALEAPAASLPEALHVFGISALPPAYMQVLSSLSRFVSVDLYLFCPSNRYWGDLRTAREANAALRRATSLEAAAALEAQLGQQSPLLTALGRSSRDFQLVLEQLAGGYGDAALFADPREIAREAGRAPSLLEALQGDVLDLRPAAAEPDAARVIAAEDDSLRVHACAGPARQIEALRDVLLDMFERRPELTVRDVLVMTPDVETYAPLIAALFDGDQLGAGAGRPKLPVSISDRTLRQGNPFAAALLALLSLADGRVTATRVLDLLAMAPVRERFGVTEQELSTLRGWVLDSGIRWGVDVEDRVAEGRPVDGSHTFRFGLARLALSAAADPPGLMLGALPLAPLNAEGAGLAGRFLAFTDALFEHRAALAAPGTVPELVARARAALDALTAAPDGQRLEAGRVREALTTLEADAQRAGLGDALGVAAFHACLAARFEAQPRGERLGGAAITVCALAPMRAVPFELICLVGMDDGVFPRRAASAGFDLSARRPEVGDCDPAEEDRHLLLEALLSARTSLQIFYTGRDARTGVEQHPAVPVAELLAYVEQSFTRAEGASLSPRHGLHPFSASDYLPSLPGPGGQRLPSGFDVGAFEAARRLRSAERSRSGPLDAAALSAPTKAQLSLEGLSELLRRPTRALMRERLSLRFADEEAALEDADPSGLGGLAAHQLRERAVEVALGEAPDWEAFAAEARATGALPQGTPGALLLEGFVAEAQALAGLAAPLLEPPARELRLSLAFPEGQLEATLPQVRGQGDLLFVAPSAPDSSRRLLPAWVRLLALQAQSEAPCRALVLGREKKGAPRCVELAVPGEGASRREAARALLGALVTDWAEGLRRPLMLFEGASFAYAKAARNEKLGPTQRRDAATGAFRGGEYSFGDLDDPFVALAYREEAPPPFAEGAAWDEFTALAERVYGPLLDGLTVRK